MPQRTKLISRKLEQDFEGGYYKIISKRGTLVQGMSIQISPVSSRFEAIIFSFNYLKNKIPKTHFQSF